MKRFLILLIFIGLLVTGGFYWYLSHISIETRPLPTLDSIVTAVGSGAGISHTVNQTILPQLSIPTSSVLIVGVLLGLILMGIGWAGYQTSQQRSRDLHRRKDIAVIQAGFQAYKQKYGHYPVSRTYEAHYYSLINLSNDWSYYGLPEHAIMRQFIPTWPILDPLHLLDNSDQTNQYLYYPHDNGARYDLFAHFELPKTAEAEDCNEKDGIPRVMGQYNFRVTSPAEQRVEKQSSGLPA